MAKQNNKLGLSPSVCKSIAIFLSVCFFSMDLQYFAGHHAYAESLRVSPDPRHGIREVNPGKIIDSLALPEELGSVQETFVPDKIPKDVPLVFYFQNAHTVYDSEKNIQRLLHYLRKRFGVDQVLLEGGEGKLESLFFRAFPDPKMKARVLDGYLRRGEMSGGESASILDEVRGARYYGIETQSLYAENKRAFLAALAGTEPAGKYLAGKRGELSEKGRTVLTEKSRRYLDGREAFLKPSSDLRAYLEMLTSLSENSREPGRFPEIEKILNAARNAEASAAAENGARYNRWLKGVEKHVLPKLKNESRREAALLLQQGLTGETDSGSLINRLEAMTASEGFRLPVPASLDSSARRAKSLASVQGTRLFEEISRIEKELRENLPQTKEERALLEAYRAIELLEKLSELELTREEWNEIKVKSEKEIGKKGASSRELYASDPLREVLRNHFRFYELAEQRDGALFGNARLKFEREKPGIAAIVTGGFHRSGISKRLKEAGIPYAVIIPAIGRLDGKENYVGVMKGDVSYRKYFSGSLWGALAKDYLSQLMKEADGRGSDSSFQLLKLWRDRMIQESIGEERVTEVCRYTKYIDDYANGQPGTAHDPRLKTDDPRLKMAQGLDTFLETYFKRLKTSLDRNIDRFGEGLKKIWNPGEVTPVTIGNLLEGIRAGGASNLAPGIGLIESAQNLDTAGRKDWDVSRGAVDERTAPREELRAETSTGYPREGYEEFHRLFRQLREARTVDELAASERDFLGHPFVRLADIPVEREFLTGNPVFNLGPNTVVVRHDVAADNAEDQNLPSIWKYGGVAEIELPDGSKEKRVVLETLNRPLRAQYRREDWLTNLKPVEFQKLLQRLEIQRVVLKEKELVDYIVSREGEDSRGSRAELRMRKRSEDVRPLPLVREVEKKIFGLRGFKMIAKDGTEYVLEVTPHPENNFFEIQAYPVIDGREGGEPVTKVTFDYEFDRSGNLTLIDNIKTQPDYRGRDIPSRIYEKLSEVLEGEVKIESGILHDRTLIELSEMLPPDLRTGIEDLLGRTSGAGTSDAGFKDSEVERLRTNLSRAGSAGFRFSSAQLAGTVIGKIRSHFGDRHEWDIATSMLITYRNPSREPRTAPRPELRAEGKKQDGDEKKPRVDPLKLENFAGAVGSMSVERDARQIEILQRLVRGSEVSHIRTSPYRSHIVKPGKLKQNLTGLKALCSYQPGGKNAPLTALYLDASVADSFLESDGWIRGVPRAELRAVPSRKSEEFFVSASLKNAKENRLIEAPQKLSADFLEPYFKRLEDIIGRMDKTPGQEQARKVLASLRTSKISGFDELRWSNGEYCFALIRNGNIDLGNGIFENEDFALQFLFAAGMKAQPKTIEDPDRLAREVFGEADDAVFAETYRRFSDLSDERFLLSAARRFRSFDPGAPYFETSKFFSGWLELQLQDAKQPQKSMTPFPVLEQAGFIAGKLWNKRGPVSAEILGAYFKILYPLLTFSVYREQYTVLVDIFDEMCRSILDGEKKERLEDFSETEKKFLRKSVEEDTEAEFHRAIESGRSRISLHFYRALTYALPRLDADDFNRVWELHNRQIRSFLLAPKEWRDGFIEKYLKGKTPQWEVEGLGILRKPDLDRFFGLFSGEPYSPSDPTLHARFQDFGRESFVGIVRIDRQGPPGYRLVTTEGMPVAPLVIPEDDISYEVDRLHNRLTEQINEQNIWRDLLIWANMRAVRFMEDDDPDRDLFHILEALTALRAYLSPAVEKKSELAPGGVDVRAWKDALVKRVMIAEENFWAHVLRDLGGYGRYFDLFSSAEGAQEARLFWVKTLWEGRGALLPQLAQKLEYQSGKIKRLKKESVLELIDTLLTICWSGVPRMNRVGEMRFLLRELFARVRIYPDGIGVEDPDGLKEFLSRYHAPDFGKDTLKFPLNDSETQPADSPVAYVRAGTPVLGNAKNTADQGDRYPGVLKVYSAEPIDAALLLHPERYWRSIPGKWASWVGTYRQGLRIPGTSFKMVNSEIPDGTMLRIVVEENAMTIERDYPDGFSVELANIPLRDVLDGIGRIDPRDPKWRKVPVIAEEGPEETGDSVNGAGPLTPFGVTIPKNRKAGEKIEGDDFYFLPCSRDGLAVLNIRGKMFYFEVPGHLNGRLVAQVAGNQSRIIFYDEKANSILGTAVYDAAADIFKSSGPGLVGLPRQDPLTGHLRPQTLEEFKTLQVLANALRPLLDDGQGYSRIDLVEPAAIAPENEDSDGYREIQIGKGVIGVDRALALGFARDPGNVTEKVRYALQRDDEVYRLRERVGQFEAIADTRREFDPEVPIPSLLARVDQSGWSIDGVNRYEALRQRMVLLHWRFQVMRKVDAWRDRNAALLAKSRMRKKDADEFREQFRTLIERYGSGGKTKFAFRGFGKGSWIEYTNVSGIPEVRDPKTGRDGAMIFAPYEGVGIITDRDFEAKEVSGFEKPQLVFSPRRSFEHKPYFFIRFENPYEPKGQAIIKLFQTEDGAPSDQEEVRVEAAVAELEKSREAFMEKLQKSLAQPDTGGGVFYRERIASLADQTMARLKKNGETAMDRNYLERRTLMFRQLARFLDFLFPEEYSHDLNISLFEMMAEDALREGADAAISRATVLMQQMIKRDPKESLFYFNEYFLGDADERKQLFVEEDLAPSEAYVNESMRAFVLAVLIPFVQKPHDKAPALYEETFFEDARNRIQKVRGDVLRAIEEYLRTQQGPFHHGVLHFEKAIRELYERTHAEPGKRPMNSAEVYFLRHLLAEKDRGLQSLSEADLRARSLYLRPFGGAEDIGASSMQIRYQETSIVADAGVKIDAVNTPPAYPFEEFKKDPPKAVFLTHAHIDHVGSAIPLWKALGKKVPFYVTPQTFELLGPVLKSMARNFSNAAGGGVSRTAFDEKDVEEFMNVARILEPNQWVLITPEMKVRFHAPVGHLLGAASLIVITPDSGLCLSGDISVRGQGSVTGFAGIPAEIPIDTFVTESTYPMEERSVSEDAEEERLVKDSLSTLEKGGKVLIPAFANGRSERILQSFLRQLAQKQISPAFRIYLDGEASLFTQIYLRSHGTGLDAASLAWIRRHVEFLSPGADRMPILARGPRQPTVVIASAGNASQGASFWWLTRLADGPNRICFTGFMDPQEMGSQFLRQMSAKKQPDSEIYFNFGPRIGSRRVLASVDSYRISGHASGPEIVERVLDPLPDLRKVWIVHGSPKSRRSVREWMKENRPGWNAEDMKTGAPGRGALAYDYEGLAERKKYFDSIGALPAQEVSKSGAEAKQRAVREVPQTAIPEKVSAETPPSSPPVRGSRLEFSPEVVNGFFAKVAGARNIYNAVAKLTDPELHYLFQEVTAGVRVFTDPQHGKSYKVTQATEDRILAAAQALGNRTRSELPPSSFKPETVRPENPSDSRSELRASAQDRLREKIAAEIENAPQKRISWERYQEMSNFDPEEGYYPGGVVQFGQMGVDKRDGITFRTNAENPQFGLAMAIQFYYFWLEMGRPEQFTIVEQGGGNGMMAKNILDGIRKGLPIVPLPDILRDQSGAALYLKEFYDHARYNLVDISPDLSRRQQKTLSDAGYSEKINVLTDSALQMPLADGSVSGVFFSHELLDTFPVRRVFNRNGQLKEIYVTRDEGGFKTIEGDLDPAARGRIESYFKLVGSYPPEVDGPLGKEMAVSLNLFPWVREINRVLKKGFVVAADYGFPATNIRYQSRLRTAVWNFDDRDILDPGIDITHNVDFETVRKIGESEGLTNDYLGRLDRGLSLFSPVLETANLEEYMLLLSKGLPPRSEVRAKGAGAEAGLNSRPRPELRAGEETFSSEIGRQLLEGKIVRATDRYGRQFRLMAYRQGNVFRIGAFAGNEEIGFVDAGDGVIDFRRFFPNFVETLATHAAPTAYYAAAVRVDHAHEGRGIGTALLIAAVHLAKALGWKRLDVRKVKELVEGHPLIRFYLKIFPHGEQESNLIHDNFVSVYDKPWHFWIDFEKDPVPGFAFDPQATALPDGKKIQPHEIPDFYRRRIEERIRNPEKVRFYSLDFSQVRGQLLDFEASVNAAGMGGVFSPLHYLRMVGYHKEARIARTRLSTGQLLTVISIPAAEGERFGFYLYRVANLGADDGVFVGYGTWNLDVKGEESGRAGEKVICGFDIFKSYRNGQDARYPISASEIYEWQCRFIQQEFRPDVLLLNARNQFENKNGVGEGWKNAIFYLKRGFYPPRHKAEADGLLVRLLRGDKLSDSEAHAFLRQASGTDYWELPLPQSEVPVTRRELRTASGPDSASAARFEMRNEQKPLPAEDDGFRFYEPVVDASMDRAAAEEWIAGMPEETLRRLAGFIVYLIDEFNAYVPYAKFVKVLRRIVGEFNRRIQDRPYVVYSFKARRSERWTYELALKLGLKSPVAVFSPQTKISLDLYLKDHPEIKDIVFLDDACYSGEQLKSALIDAHEKIASIRPKKPEKKTGIRLHLLTPFMTTGVLQGLEEKDLEFLPAYAVPKYRHEKMRTVGEMIEELISRSENDPSTVPYSREELEAFESQINERFSSGQGFMDATETTLTWFAHKMADSFSLLSVDVNPEDYAPFVRVMEGPPLGMSPEKAALHPFVPPVIEPYDPKYPERVHDEIAGSFWKKRLQRDRLAQLGWGSDAIDRAEGKDRREMRGAEEIFSESGGDLRESVDFARQHLELPYKDEKGEWIRGNRWVRVAAFPREVEEFQRKWQKTAGAVFKTELAGIKYVFEQNALDKAADWFRGNAEFERSGYFVAEERDGGVRVFDFIPMPSYATDPTLSAAGIEDPQTRQSTRNFGELFDEEVEKALFGDDAVPALPLNKILIDAHSHPDWSAYPDGPSKNDPRAEMPGGVGLVFGLQKHKFTLFNQGGISVEIPHYRFDEFDDEGRLKVVRDASGKVWEAYDYHEDGSYEVTLRNLKAPENEIRLRVEEDSPGEFEARIYHGEKDSEPAGHVAFEKTRTEFILDEFFPRLMLGNQPPVLRGDALTILNWLAGQAWRENKGLYIYQTRTIPLMRLSRLLMRGNIQKVEGNDVRNFEDLISRYGAFGEKVLGPVEFRRVDASSPHGYVTLRLKEKPDLYELRESEGIKNVQDVRVSADGSVFDPDGKRLGKFLYTRSRFRIRGLPRWIRPGTFRSEFRGDERNPSSIPQLSEGDLAIFRNALKTGDFKPAEAKGFAIGTVRIGQLFEDLGFGRLALPRSAFGYISAMILRKDGRDPMESDQLERAVSELVNNVVEHVVEHVPTGVADEVERKRFLILGRKVRHGNRSGIEVIVADRGEGVPARALGGTGYSSTGDQHRGKGVELVKNIAIEDDRGFLEVQSEQGKVVFTDGHPEGLDGDSRFSMGTLVRFVRYLPETMNSRQEMRSNADAFDTSKHLKTRRFEMRASHEGPRVSGDLASRAGSGIRLKPLSAAEGEEILRYTEIRGDSFHGRKLTNDDLRDLGMPPAYGLEFEGEKFWFAPSVFDVGHGRMAITVYVKDDRPARAGEAAAGGAAHERYVARTYYRSNSHGGIWRYLPAVLVIDGKIAWYDKGFDENSLPSPYQALDAINQIRMRAGIRVIKGEEERERLFAGTTREIKGSRKSLHYGVHDSYAEVVDPSGMILNSGSDGIGLAGILTRPEKVRFDRPEEAPDYDKLVAEFEIETSLNTDGVPDLLRMTSPSGQVSSTRIGPSDEIRSEAVLAEYVRVSDAHGAQRFYAGDEKNKKLLSVDRDGAIYVYHYEGDISTAGSPQYVTKMVSKQADEIYTVRQEEGLAVVDLPFGRQFFNPEGMLAREEYPDGSRAEFIYGLARARVFESGDAAGKLRYVFIQDKFDRVMVGSIERLSKLTRVGLYEKWVRGGSLTTPIYDYLDNNHGFGISDYIDSSDRKGSRREYVSMWPNYLSRIPVIRAYIDRFIAPAHSPSVKAPAAGEESPKDRLVDRQPPELRGEAPAEIRNTGEITHEDLKISAVAGRDDAEVARPQEPAAVFPAVTSSALFLVADEGISAEIDTEGVLVLRPRDPQDPPKAVPLSRMSSFGRRAYTIGRHPNCDLPLSAGSVSRWHAALTFEVSEDAGGTKVSVFIEDASSRNGTKVNGELIHGKTLLVERVLPQTPIRPEMRSEMRDDFEDLKRSGEAPGWRKLLAAPLMQHPFEPDYPDVAWFPMWESRPEFFKGHLGIDPVTFTQGEEVAILGFGATEFGRVLKLCPQAEKFHLVNFSDEAIRKHAPVIWHAHGASVLRRVRIYPADAARLGRLLPPDSQKMIFASGIFSNDFNSSEKNREITQEIFTALKPGGIAVLGFSPNVRSRTPPDPSEVFGVL